VPYLRKLNRVHPWENNFFAPSAPLRENAGMSTVACLNLPDAQGRFGPYGGLYGRKTKKLSAHFQLRAYCSCWIL
jgi:hypothetical protein